MTHALQPEEEPADPGGPEVIGLDDERTGEALDALSSTTARAILSTLYDDPRTPPELREAVGTSLQNVHYHLENLQAAGLIKEAGTRFSEKGSEMTVYGPASEAVVVMAGESDDRSLLRKALGRLIGALGVLAAASLAVGELFGPGGDTGTYESTDGPRIAAESAGDAAGGAAGGPDPALVFFAGGLCVIALAACWWGYREYRE
jgi:DNA-binding transcriptional ArsR family regulator